MAKRGKKIKMTGPRPSEYPTELAWPYKAPQGKPIQDWTPEEKSLHQKYLAWNNRKINKQKMANKARARQGTKNLTRDRNNSEAWKVGAFKRWMKQRMISDDLRNAGENLIEAYVTQHAEKLIVCLDHMMNYATFGRSVIPEVDQNGDFIYVDDDGKEVPADSPGARMKERVLICEDDSSHRASIMQFLERVIGAPGKHIKVEHEHSFSDMLQGKIENAERYRDETNRKHIPSRVVRSGEPGDSGSADQGDTTLDALRAARDRALVLPAGEVHMQGNGPRDPEEPDRESSMAAEDDRQGGEG